MTFEDLKITRQFLNALDDIGITEPTEIQKLAIPRVRSGQDVIGIAPTGTGKTAAYLLPLLQEVKYAQGSDPRLLILAPTKELVLQLVYQCAELAEYTDLRIIGLYGGVGPKTQIEEISHGVDIIIATPGRFMEIYLKEALGVRKVRYLVLDEADRMMDMGFIHQIRRVLEVIPRKRQNLLFSATFDERVKELSEDFLEFPQRVEAAPHATTAYTITQYYYEAINFRTKLNLLLHLLEDESLNRVILFCRTKEYANNVAKFLERKEVGSVRVIHSNKGQNSRINAFKEFRSGDIRILVATDVAARGIDISLVSHVINFSVPRNYIDYVHRVGRTGRAKHEGIAYTFLDESERYHLRQIEHLIKKDIERLELPEEVGIEPTPKDEKREILIELDNIKKLKDPSFQGAFHTRKKNSEKKKFQKKKKRR
ncbi:MAG: DEAD/DEAH box helicase [Flavobacteriales bacterium]